MSPNAALHGGLPPRRRGSVGHAPGGAAAEVFIQQMWIDFCSSRRMSSRSGHCPTAGYQSQPPISDRLRGGSNKRWDCATALVLPQQPPSVILPSLLKLLSLGRGMLRQERQRGQPVPASCHSWHRGRQRRGSTASSRRGGVRRRQLHRSRMCSAQAQP